MVRLTCVATAYHFPLSIQTYFGGKISQVFLHLLAEVLHEPANHNGDAPCTGFMVPLWMLPVA